MLFSSGRPVQIHSVCNVEMENWLGMKLDAHTSLYSDEVQNESSSERTINRLPTEMKSSVDEMGLYFTRFSRQWYDAQKVIMLGFFDDQSEFAVCFSLEG